MTVNKLVFILISCVWVGFPLFQFAPIAFPSITWFLSITEESLAPSSLLSSNKYLYTQKICALSLLFSWPNGSSSLSLSSYVRCSKPLTICGPSMRLLQHVDVCRVLVSWEQEPGLTASLSLHLLVSYASCILVVPYALLHNKIIHSLYLTTGSLLKLHLHYYLMDGRLCLSQIMTAIFHLLGEKKTQNSPGCAILFENSRN